MNEDFQKIYYKFPKLLNSFSEIQNSSNTAKEAMRAITKILQKEANLYSATLEVVSGDFLIRDSAFGKNKEDVQDYLRHSSPANISNSNFSVNIQNRKLLIGSMEQEVNPMYFCSAPFPLTTSWILFPVKRKGKVFCFIGLGSEKIIMPKKYKNNSFISKVFKFPFEVLMFRINQIADNKPEDD